MTVAIANPASRRARLAAVSTHSSTSPVRGSASNAMRAKPAPMDAKDGSSLSSGLSASRDADPAR